MQYRIRYTFLQFGLIVIVAGLTVVSISRLSSAGNATATQQPEVLRLETRVAQMEQRLYMMETSLRNLDTRIANMSGRGANATDTAALGTELYVLQQRLAEHECALAKLDERTLSAELRAARKRSGAANNPCRTMFDTPLRLPTDR